MPVPTADLYDKQRAEEDNVSNSNAAAHTTKPDSDESYFSTGPGTSQYSGAGRPLTREEADRLYEERMEEEYAKRDGGA